MQGTATATVQYDTHTWTVEAGPNAMGYYRLSRTDTDYPHTAYVHGNDLTFQPEAADVLAVVDALYRVYLNRDENWPLPAAEATMTALETLGWDHDRAYRAATHVAGWTR
jgi:hypothetical protein